MKDEQILEDVRTIIKEQLFECVEQVSDKLQEKLNISKEDIKFEVVNGRNTITIKIPQCVDYMNYCILITGDK